MKPGSFCSKRITYSVKRHLTLQHSLSALVSRTQFVGDKNDKRIKDNNEETVETQLLTSHYKTGEGKSRQNSKGHGWRKNVP